MGEGGGRSKRGDDTVTAKADVGLEGRVLHPKYYGSDIRIRTGQEGIGNSSNGHRTAYRDWATDSVGARLGSTDSAAPGNPRAKYQHRPG